MPGNNAVKARIVQGTSRIWLALWRDFEPLWCVVGVSAAVAVVGVASATSLHRLDSGHPGGARPGGRRRRRWWSRPRADTPPALVGLIVLAAVDLGCYGLSYAVHPRERRAGAVRGIGSHSARQSRRPGRRLVAPLRRAGPAHRRLDDAGGWRRADGYAGLEPRRQLDYRPLARPARGRRSLGRARPVHGRHRRSETVRRPLAGSARPVAAGAAGDANPRPAATPAVDIARICPDTTALCEVPLGSAGVEAGQGRA